MSLFEAIAAKEQHSEQGWSYSNSYDRTSNTANSNTAPSAEEWHPHLNQQDQATLSGPRNIRVHGQEVNLSDAEDEVTLEDDDSDFDHFEMEQQNNSASNQQTASSGFQNSFNEYLLSQQNQSEDVNSEYDLEDDLEQFMEQTQPAGDGSEQQTGPVQMGSPALEQQPSCLPHSDYGPPYPCNTKPSSWQQNASQQSVGQNQQGYYGQQHIKQTNNRRGMSGTWGQAQQVVNKQSVSPQSVAGVRHFGQYENSCQMVRVQQPSPGQPNQQHMHARFSSRGHGQDMASSWHAPQHHQQRPYNQRQQQQLSPSQYQQQFGAHTVDGGCAPSHSHMNDPNSSNSFKFQSQQEHHSQHFSQHYTQNSPHLPMMQGTGQCSWNRPPPGSPASWHSSSDLSQNSPSILENSPPLVILRSPEMSMQHSPQASQQSPSGSLHRQRLPQDMQKSFQTPAVNSPPLPPGKSHQVSSQGPQHRDKNTGGGNQQNTQDPNLSKDMQKLFNLTSAPNVIVQGDRGTQDLQEDTYYSVHRGGVHNATSSSTVLYNGLDGQKHLCSQPHNIDSNTGCSAMGRVQMTESQNNSEYIISGDHPHDHYWEDPYPPTGHHPHRPEQRDSTSAVPGPEMVDGDNNIPHDECAAGYEDDETDHYGSYPMDPQEYDGYPDHSMDSQMAEGFEDDFFDDQMEEYFEGSFCDEEEDGEWDDEDYFDPEHPDDGIFYEEDAEGYVDSPPPLTVALPPRASAPSEAWPTPMPSLDLQKDKSGSPSPDESVEFIASSKHGSSNSPVFGSSPCAMKKDRRPSSADSVSPTPGSVQSNNTDDPKEEIQDPSCKRTLVDEEEGVVLCKYCGFSNSNFETCEGCKRKLPTDITFFVKKRKVEGQDLVSDQERTRGGGKVDVPPSERALTMDKKTFYRNKTKNGDSADDVSDNLVIKSTERSFTRLDGSRASHAASHNAKSTVIMEPVTVTISSDEDEDPSSETYQQPSATSKPVNPSASAAPPSAVSASNCDDEDFFPSSASKPTSAFSVCRRNKVADPGHCTPTPRPISPRMRFIGEGIYFNVRGVRIGSMRTTGLEVRFMTRSIAFTVISDRTHEEMDFFIYVTDILSVQFTLNQPQPVIFIKVTPGCGGRLRSHLKMSLKSPEFFDPGSTDPQKNMIVVIIDTMTDERGLRQMLLTYSRSRREVSGFLRELMFDEANDLLVMSSPPVLKGPANDTNLKGLRPPLNPSAPPDGLEEKGDGDGIVEGQDEMSAPLPMAGDTGTDSPGVCREYEDSESRSSSPYIGFTGPIEKLLIYPPPPAKGGITITTEDLFCLNDGEFLNDVILDFYLKYLFLERLTDEDRQRTHIFSSFFFKRLTQRQARSVQEQEEVKLTLPERRHARVKTWTRQVDIFSKDFLFIPINENAHWFLAVVCFPSLEVQEYVSFQPTQPAQPAQPSQPTQPTQPAQLPAEEEAGKSGDTQSPPPEESQGQEQTDGATNEEGPPEAAAETSQKEEFFLGKVIPTEEALKDSSTHSVGLKQACILIMDSLMGPSRESIIKILKEYLQEEWNLKRGTSRDILKIVRGDCPCVPQQTNFSDCGVFVLQYAESFFENPIANFSLPMKLEGWFPLAQVERKREEIQNLILHLMPEDSR